MVRNPDQYRPAAGMVVFNRDGKVFMGRRNNPKGPFIWQFPQGGIDKGERPYHAAVRELFEETGITKKHTKLLGKYPGWQYYDFPADYQRKKVAQGWRGQRQKWYAFRYLGKDKAINLNAHGPIEFSDWRWDDLERAPKLVVPFKQDVYENVCEHFSVFAKPVK